MDIGVMMHGDWRGSASRILVVGLVVGGFIGHAEVPHESRQR